MFRAALVRLSGGGPGASWQSSCKVSTGGATRGRPARPGIVAPVGVVKVVGALFRVPLGAASGAVQPSWKWDGRRR